MGTKAVKKDNIPFFPAKEGSPLLLEKGMVNLYLCSLDEQGELKGKRVFLTQAFEGDILFPLQEITCGDESFSFVAIPARESSIKKLKLSEDDLAAARRWVSRACEMLGQRKAEIDHFCAGLTLAQLEEFNAGFLAKAAALAKEKDQKLHAANRNRYINEEHFMHSGMEILASVLGKKKKSYAAAQSQSVGDPLFEACSVVAHAQKMSLNVPFALKNNLPSANPLGDIAQASHFRTREVVLKDTWYKHPNGPLLAYRKETHEPLALLPRGAKGYEYYDPQTKQSVRITPENAEEIDAQAVMFYRSLPMRKLKAKDIFQFILEGTSVTDWVWIFVMGLGGGLLGMLTPEITGKVFDTVIPDGDSAMMVQIGFLMVALALTTFAFELTRSFATQRIEGTTERDLQSAVWDRLLSLPVGFFKDYTAGELAECAMSVSQIHKTISGSIINTLISGIFSVFYIIVLFTKGKKLAWIALIALIVIMAFTILLGWLQLKHEKRLLDISNETSGKMFGWLNGLSKIKMAGAERRVFFNWSNLFTDSRVITFRKQNIGSVLEIFNSVVSVLLAIILYFAIFNLKDFTIAAGTFIAFNTALEKLLESSLKMSQVVIDANIIIPLYGKVKPIFEALPEYDDQKSDPGKLQGDIELSHINFRYETDGPLIIKDVCLHIKSGEHVALVGPSGSGKSTLFRILLGFEHPENGQIFFDGMSADQLDVRSVRRQLGVVLQSGQLLTGTIYENIIGSNPGLTQDDVMRAITQAGMEEDIKEMPMGLHTVVTEGASTLSGGQRQRLLIARALVSNPSILFFDEATSALDNNTQKIVSDSINQLDATRITIAHRLSTIVDCDRIVVLENGVITEQGTYDELMALNGTFAMMAKRQIA